MAQDRVHKPGRANERDSSAQGSKKTSGRKRATLACEECRVRKRRCNGLIPCEGCAQRLTDCKYAADVEAQRWHQSMIHILKAKLEELEQAESQPHGIHRRGPLANAGANTTEEGVAQDPATCDDTPIAMDLEPAGPSGQPPPTTPPPTTTIPPTGHHAPQQLQLAVQSPQSHAASDRVVAYVPGQGDCPGVPSMPGPETTASCHSSPSRCMQPSNFERMMMPISQAMTRKDGWAPDTSILSAGSSMGTGAPPRPQSPTARCTCDRSLRAMRCNLPLRKDSDALVVRYFSRHNRIFPILHRSTFLAQYERLWDSEFSSGHPRQRGCSGLCTQKSKGKMLPTIVHLVLALGSLFSSQSLEENASRAESFYRMAQGINFLEMMDDEVSIELIQVGLLMGMYLQSTERYSKCWNVTGFTIRMAQNMGLHFTVAEARKRGLLAPDAAPEDVEMRTRVWYGCILLDTDIALSFGQPSMIPVRPDHVKPSFEPLHAYELSHLQTEPNMHVAPSDLPTILEYYYEKIRLYDILRQVIQRDSRYACPATTPTTDIDARMREVLSLDTKVMEWQDALPSYLKHPKIFEHERAPPVAPGTGPRQLEALDVGALSERLYNRFLHVRQLILRPALELLFRQDQDEAANHKKSIEAKLREATLSDIASQCVRSAVEMIEFLGSGIEAESFSCWWYNISMLYTSGTTLLMGQFCRLKGPGLDRQSLAASWNYCLVSLSRYRDISSIAQRSCNVLREYSKRLLAQRQEDPGRLSVHNGVHVPATFPTASVSASSTDFRPLQEEPLEQHNHQQHQQHQPAMDDFTVDSSTSMPLDHSVLLDMNPQRDHHLPMFLQDSYLMDTSAWPYLPFLSQLEDLPSSDPNMSFRMS